VRPVQVKVFKIITRVETACTIEPLVAEPSVERSSLPSDENRSGNDRWINPVKRSALLSIDIEAEIIELKRGAPLNQRAIRSRGDLAFSNARQSRSCGLPLIASML
jgi:hypothetical protein